MSLPLILSGFKYLVENRKLTEQTIRTFGLSYVDLNGEVYAPADYQGTLPTMDKRFYNSTLFPIQSVYGETVGISCRPLGSSQTKYINSNYDKAKHLYGLFQVYKECLKEKSCYVVEGNIDTLMMYQCGIHNVVGLLGSAFSFTQLCLLSRFVKKLVIVPDGDLAGSKIVERLKKAMDKKFYDSDLEFFHVQLPMGFDPDNYLKKFSKEDFLSLPENKLVI